MARRRLHWLFGISLTVLLPVLAGSMSVEVVQACQTVAVDSNTERGPTPGSLALSSLQSNESSQELINKLRRLEKEVRARTEPLQRQIDEDLANAWKSDAINLHSSTLSALARTLAQLGQFHQAKQLHEQIRLSGKKILIHAISEDWYWFVRAHAARGDYSMAMDTLKTQPISNGQHHGVIIHAIRRGDLDIAQELIKQLAATDATKIHASTLRQSLLAAYAEMAVAAHHLGDHDRIEPALRQYRAVLEVNPTVSTRPLNEDVQWLHAVERFGSYFVLVLANCGQATMAESLWTSEKLGDQPPDGVLPRPFSTLQLCSRMALAGETEAAQRLGHNTFGAELPGHLLQTLCIRAIKDGNDEEAAKFAEEFLDSIENESLLDSEAHARLTALLSERAMSLYRICLSAHKLQLFIRRIRTAGRVDLCIPAARMYVKLADRFADEFENRVTVADVRSLQNWISPGSRWSLDTIINVLPESEVFDFAIRQKGYFDRNYGLLDNGFYSPYPFRDYAVSLARLGHTPWKLTVKLNIEQRRAAFQNLQQAGFHKEARGVYRTLHKDVSKVSQLGYVSGSEGGRVMNGATCDRILVAQLAAQCDALESGIELIELIEDAGEKVDGYRNLAMSYAQATNPETAFTWAKSIADEQRRLAACVGILQAHASEFGKSDPGELERAMSEFEGGAFGYLSIFWGC